jgi:signal recognition particle subunit SRP54
MEQLAVLGKQIGVDTLPIVAGQIAVADRPRALEAGKLGGYDVVMLDTAGRTTLDEALMAEVAEVKAAANPHEVLLVADSAHRPGRGQPRRSFDERVGVTGIVLTRVDGDGRGGAALSMRAVTGKPIKLIGTGEKTDALEDFHPSRIANRILGMGDIVSLVEKAAANDRRRKGQKAAERMRQGPVRPRRPARPAQPDGEDRRHAGLMGMLPGMGKMKGQIAAMGIDDKMFEAPDRDHLSMTRQERKNPDILKQAARSASPRAPAPRREDVNKLLKMHRQMADMMKSVPRQEEMTKPTEMRDGMFDVFKQVKARLDEANLSYNPYQEEVVFTTHPKGRRPCPSRSA